MIYVDDGNTMCAKDQKDIVVEVINNDGTYTRYTIGGVLYVQQLKKNLLSCAFEKGMKIIFENGQNVYFYKNDKLIEINIIINYIN